MTWYNPFSWFSGGTTVVEADVAAFVQKVKTGVATAEADAQNVYNWIGTNGPQEIATINAVLQIVLQVASVADPRVATAVALVNAFTTALNALVAAKAANESIVSAVVDAYKALKNMQAASATAVVAHL